MWLSRVISIQEREITPKHCTREQMVENPIGSVLEILAHHHQFTKHVHSERRKSHKKHTHRYTEKEGIQLTCMITNLVGCKREILGRD